MTVKLEYFKRTGKWYESGEYETDNVELFEIWDEVKEKRDSGNLPGLAPGCGREFIVSVDVPDHKYRHPKLIM